MSDTTRSFKLEGTRSTRNSPTLSKKTSRRCVPSDAHHALALGPGAAVIMVFAVMQNELVLPTADEEEESTKKTQEALQLLTSGKIAAARPTQVPDLTISMPAADARK